MSKQLYDTKSNTAHATNIFMGLFFAPMTHTVKILVLRIRRTLVQGTTYDIVSKYTINECHRPKLRRSQFPSPFGTRAVQSDLVMHVVDVYVGLRHALQAL